MENNDYKKAATYQRGQAVVDGGCDEESEGEEPKCGCEVGRRSSPQSPVAGLCLPHQRKKKINGPDPLWGILDEPGDFTALQVVKLYI